MYLPEKGKRIDFMGGLEVGGYGTGVIRWGREGWRKRVQGEKTGRGGHLGGDVDT